MPETTYRATGKRKSSVARVTMKTGTGAITVNGRPAPDYFNRPTSMFLIMQPFEATQLEGRFDVIANIDGGGLSGQAGALRHGITRALILMDPELKSALKRAGLVTRDPRVKERKKYGLAGARRAYQFSKR